MDENLQDFMLFLITFILSVYFYLPAMVLGFICGGRLSGYKLVSFSIFGKTFNMENGKPVKKRSDFAYSQVVMLPPEVTDGRYPFLLYVLGGAITVLAIGVIFIALYFITKKTLGRVSSVFLALSAFGLSVGLSDLIPYKRRHHISSGYKAIFLRKNEKAREMYRLVCLALSNLYSGKRYRDMPPEWFGILDEVVDNYEADNPLLANAVCMNYDRLMAIHDFKKAKELGNKMINEIPDINELVKNIVRLDLLFLEVVGERRQEEIDRLYNDKVKSYLLMPPAALSKQLFQYAYSKLITKDHARAQVVLKKINEINTSRAIAYAEEETREWLRIIDHIAQSQPSA